MVESSLQGKVALVTGSGRGIGRAIAENLAACGAHLMLCSRTESELKQVMTFVTAQGVRADERRVDLSDVAQSEQLVEHTEQLFGRIDILVNNAGTGTPKGLFEVQPADWDRVHALNLRGLFFLTRRVVRGMIDRGQPGRIINLSSLAAQRGRPGGAVYGASKGGVEALTRMLAVELGGKQITVNAVAPSYVRTSLNEKMFQDPAVLQPLLERTPTGRFPEASDVAKMVAFLASDHARNITGQVISIDGGRTAG